MNPLKATLKRGVKSFDRILDGVESLTGVEISWRAKDVAKLLRNPRRLRRKLALFKPGVIHVGKRGSLQRTWHGERIVKRFADTSEGKASYEAEALAHELFRERAWKMPVLELGEMSLTMPALPPKSRLDRAARGLSKRERRALAADALEIAFEIFAAGYAHRDFHAENLYLVDGALVLGDFETLAPYPETQWPAFAASYDLVGAGLPSPHKTGNACYAAASPTAIAAVLGVSLEEALAELRERLKDELEDACATFHKDTDGRPRKRRNTLRSGRIYGSFRVPGFEVSANEAQRNSARRLERFGVTADEVRGRTVLDLGCNVGAMSFSVFDRFAPASVLGVEYDASKVAIASKLARFGGLDRVKFQTGDIDVLEAQHIGGPFDVVLCLAIESHLRDRPRLFRLLGDLTRSVLLFEGNAGSDEAELTARLRDAGFAHVTALGHCDDDAVPANNKRPMYVARR